MKFLFALILVLSATVTGTLFADPIPVRQPQGVSHGFLIVRSATGKMLGTGEYSQTVHQQHLTSRLTLRFRDGSLDDETCTYTQHEVFALLSDHHIQRGPFFTHPIDYLIEAGGNVTTRSDGKVDTNHFDLPSDLSNGLVSVMLLNLSPTTPEIKVGMLAPTGKGRLIKLAISPAGKQSFIAVAGLRRDAITFRIRPELDGLVGVIAPLIGKQPLDIYIDVLQSDAPLIVRETGALAEGGPVVSIELAGTSFRYDPRNRPYKRPVQGAASAAEGLPRRTQNPTAWPERQAQVESSPQGRAPVATH